VINLETIEVQTNVGKFILRKPLAGERNKALEKAEMKDGTLKNSVFMTELLPYCIKENPFDATLPLRKRLELIDFEEWDKLANALGNLLSSSKLESDIKKLNSLSESEEVQTPKPQE